MNGAKIQLMLKNAREQTVLQPLWIPNIVWFKTSVKSRKLVGITTSAAVLLCSCAFADAKDLSMKKILFSLFAFSVVVALQAQQTSKLDLHLYKRLTESAAPATKQGLLVKGNATEIKLLTEQYSGVYKYGYGQVSSVEIPENKIVAFSKEQAVLKIENTFAKGRFLMDTARIRNNIDSVQQGYAPLIQAYKGTGVIVGIIDGGIYWQHGDFKDPADSSSTRIRYIWDQVDNNTNTPPLPYSYGHQWSWIDINAGNCTHVPPANDFGHGTCVAGIAAGNSLSTRGGPYENQLTGVAPESEIIAVRIKDDDNFLDNVADAVDYIFKKADAMGKPCVINTSIGTYYGSHDGRDLATYAMEYLLDQRNGRSLVAAGGNGGNISHHLGYSIPADSAFTFFKYNAAAQEVYFDFWADTADFSQANFSIGCNDTSGNDLGRINYLNVPVDFNPPPGSGTIINRNLFSGTNLLGQISMQATLDEDRYHVEVIITPTNTSNYWRLQTTGSGTFDLWSSSSLIGSADMVDSVSIGGGQHVYIQYPAYRHSDLAKTIVSSWQCSDKVITVGNYSNRAGYLDRDSIYRDLTIAPYYEVVGQRFATSSFGPTRDERLKPDIMATGSTTICTGDAGFIAAATSAANRVKVYITKKHIRNGGTSMAAPIVTGIAALYLQKRPTATWNEIKQALICTAVRDSFTGPNANSEYGNGKVSAFHALTYDLSCITFGAIDTGCINYNPLANVDSGVCVHKVYGCTDSLADNYNPAANVSDGSCDYTGIKAIGDNFIAVKVMPNPFSSSTRFTLFTNGYEYKNGEIKIYNQLGALSDIITIAKGATHVDYVNPALAKGVYYYTLELDGKKMKSGKLVIE